MKSAPKVLLGLLLGFGLLSSAAGAYAIVLQPGPGQGKDIWTTSLYSYRPSGGGPGGGLDDDVLRVGGWGDLYYSLIQFDLSDSTLPKVPSSAIVRLYNTAYPGNGPTPMTLHQITQFWDWRTQGTGSDRDRLWWADQPPTIQLGATAKRPAVLPAPPVDTFYDIDITDLYTFWQANPSQNFGLELRPTLENNNWNLFLSSDYQINPMLRPQLIITVAPVNNPPVAPGGLYIGYYHEDPVSNPEDPVPGTLYLSLPAGDSSFAGTMFFTYLGCQTISAGTISGSKTALSLSGRWSGPVDNTLQAGSFSGTYDAALGRYTGTYTVDGGKQFVNLQPCIQYYIAPNGTWELSSVGQSVPASFVIGITGSVANWPSTPGATLTLIAIVDAGLATSGSTGHAVKWQSLLFSSVTSFNLASVGQVLAENDVLTVATFDALGRRIAFGSKGSNATATAGNYQGLWWNAPAGSESGWGINVAHQGDTIFASWFTYDLAGKGLWLVMTAMKTGNGIYAGTLFQLTGPAFDAVPFPPLGSPGGAAGTVVGTGTLTFTDTNDGSFAYTVNGIAQTKTITREAFGTLPTCTYSAQPNLALATNYQDLWWAVPGGSESGWGVNLTHQGDTIFASWFTFDHDRMPMWLVVSAPKTAPGTYMGTLYRLTGPPFNAVPFPPLGSLGGAIGTSVGTATFTFSDGNTATFAYTFKGGSQTKVITRELFQPPAGTVCQ